MQVFLSIQQNLAFFIQVLFKSHASCKWDLEVSSRVPPEVPQGQGVWSRDRFSAGRSQEEVGERVKVKLQEVLVFTRRTSAKERTKWSWRQRECAVLRLQSLRSRRPRWQRWDTGDELWGLHPLLF